MRGRKRTVARAPRRARSAESIAGDRHQFATRLCQWAGFSLAGAPPELCELAHEAGRKLLRAQIAGLVTDPRRLFLGILAVLIRERLRTLPKDPG